MIKKKRLKPNGLKKVMRKERRNYLRICHRLLLQSCIMFDFQYGASLDDLTNQFDPLKQFISGKTLSSSTFLAKKSRKNTRTAMHSTLIAVDMLSRQSVTINSPLQQDKDENLDVATLTQNRSVYFSNRPDQLPIIIIQG
jgi:hypothetical protein